VTNGEVVIATRFRNSHTEEPPSLYYTKKPRYECSETKRCYKTGQESFHSVVISSEPLSYNEDEWALVPKNHFVIITKNHRVILEPIEFDSDLFCDSPVEAKTTLEMDEVLRKSLDMIPCTGEAPLTTDFVPSSKKNQVAVSSTPSGIFNSLTPPPSPNVISPKPNSTPISVVANPLLLTTENKTEVVRLSEQKYVKGPDGNEKLVSAASCFVEQKEITSIRANFMKIENTPQALSIQLSVGLNKDSCLLVASVLVVLFALFVFVI
jgi:hypothetical protein